MTKADYVKYELRFRAFMQAEGICNLSRASDCDEEFFSWFPCDCCLAPLGGNRVTANGYNPTTKEVQVYTICTDCEYYAEYGRLDDLTMMEMSE